MGYPEGEGGDPTRLVPSRLQVINGVSPYFSVLGMESPKGKGAPRPSRPVLSFDYLRSFGSTENDYFPCKFYSYTEATTLLLM